MENPAFAMEYNPKLSQEEIELQDRTACIFFLLASLSNYKGWEQARSFPFINGTVTIYRKYYGTTYDSVEQCVTTLWYELEALYVNGEPCRW